MREMKDSGVAWIGEIPANWKIVPLKSLFSFGKGLPITKDNLEDTGIPVISYGQIHAKWNSGVTTHRELLRYVNESYLDTNPQSLVRRGDLIMADTSEDREGCGNCAYVDTDETLFAGYHTIILRSINETDNKYLAYLFLTDSWRSQIRQAVSGVKLFSVSRRILGSASVIVPDNADEIVAYLDDKCAQVNTLISNVQAQIEKLKAYKQSLIAEVVTKGLDPTVPMKDSGFEWIGEIPAHWGVTRIKNMFELWNERNDEADLTKVNLISLYTDLGVVQHSDLTATTGNRAVTAEGYKIVRKHDIVVNIILCWMGAVGMSQYDGVTSPAYDIYRPLKDTNSEYYHYLFRTNRFNGECYRYGRGIMMMRWRTYSTEFRAINIPCPPAEEQKKIVTHLNEKCNKIDQLIAIKQAKIEKLEQYKRSLIYEYVTGKREVS